MNMNQVRIWAGIQCNVVGMHIPYASDSQLLFDWCWEKKVPLKFWGRLDDTVAVKTNILSDFLKRHSENYICKLVQHHHAKIIWWHGLGVYIGSANLSNKAWYNNVEAGCFFEESEIDGNMSADIKILFKTLDSHASPLTDELYNEMVARLKEVERKVSDADKFWSSPSFKKWDGLVHIAPKTAIEQKRADFLEEWHSTLQDLRRIAKLVSRDDSRPEWISADIPTGAQVDQFLHGHYYQRTFQGRKAKYQDFYEQNKNRSEEALREAILWWSNLTKAPENEDTTLNERAPFLRSALSRDKLNNMTYEDFKGICEHVYAIKDYSRRVPNKVVFLPDDGTQYSIPQKIEALAKKIWDSRSGNGSRVDEMLKFILYGGTKAQLPERLWDAISDSKWKINCLGVSALGEIIGWAMPDIFPPRNGRTSKALKSLGYDVKVHIE